MTMLVKTEPTSSLNQRTTKEVEQTCLEVMGHHFTLAFIVKQDNKKLYGFDADAETCLRKLTKWKTELLWTLFWVGLGGIMTLGIYCGAIIDNWSVWSQILLSLIVFLLWGIAAIYASVNLPYSKVTTTQRHVATAWVEFRKIALSTDIVTKLRYRIGTDNTYDNTNVWNFDLSRKLVSAIEDEVNELTKAFKEAEKNQDPKQKELRQKFAEIDKLVQALGYKALDWHRLNE